MKSISRVFLLGALMLVLLTAACGADQGATPTFIGTMVTLDTITPAGGVDNTATAETATTAETAVGGLETPTVSTTLGATDTVPTVVGTLSTATTVTSGTPVIPVTGADIVLVECQFCVDTMAHALLVLPDTATFKITSPATTTTTSTTSVAATEPVCTTVEVNNGRQVVLCSGPEMTPITLNICLAGNNCTDFPVDLLACPLTQAPVLPNSTQQAPGNGGGSGSPTSTLPVPTIVISTPTP